MWLLAAQSLRSVRIARQNLIAANLAQEGLELVRNIRDSNWHQGRKTDGVPPLPCVPSSLWRNRLCDGSWRVTYTENHPLPLGANPRLKVDTNGLYQYDDGSLSLFRRHIEIITPPDDLATPVREDFVSMRIQSIVEWGERELVVEDELWNWFGEP